MSTDQKEKEYLAPTASGASSAAEQRQTAPAARRLLATAGAARWPLFSSPAGDTPLLAPYPCRALLRLDCRLDKQRGHFRALGAGAPFHPSAGDLPLGQGWEPRLGLPPAEPLCRETPRVLPRATPRWPWTTVGPLTLPRWPGDRDTLAPALWGLPPSPCLVPHQGQSPGTAGRCPARGLSVGLCRGSQHPKPGPRGEGRALCDGRQRARGPRKASVRVCRSPSPSGPAGVCSSPAGVCSRPRRSHHWGSLFQQKLRLRRFLRLLKTIFLLQLFPGLADMLS